MSLEVAGWPAVLYIRKTKSGKYFAFVTRQAAINFIDYGQNTDTGKEVGTYSITELKRHSRKVEVVESEEDLLTEEERK